MFCCKYLFCINFIVQVDAVDAIIESWCDKLITLKLVNLGLNIVHFGVILFSALILLSI
jgi:hypothetical protein